MTGARTVTPAEAGVPGRKVAARLHETPAFAGVTAWGSRQNGIWKPGGSCSPPVTARIDSAAA
jgi:hypothetical protein